MHLARWLQRRYRSLEMILSRSRPAEAWVQVLPSKTFLRFAEIDFPQCSPFPTTSADLSPVVVTLLPFRSGLGPAHGARRHLRRWRKRLVSVFAPRPRGRQSPTLQLKV